MNHDLLPSIVASVSVYFPNDLSHFLLGATLYEPKSFLLLN